MMPHHAVSSFINNNHGNQVGHNTGVITSNSHIYLPPKTTPKPRSMVPFSRDAEFVDRADLFDQITQIYSKPTPRVALWGLGGMGKSQLAIEYTYRVDDNASKKNEKIWLFWVHASTKARVQESFRDIAEAVELPGRDEPNSDVIELVSRWLSIKTKDKWFMVLDSADDYNVFYNTVKKGEQSVLPGEKTAKSLWKYLPKSSNGTYLITTRNKDLAYRLTDNPKYVIEVGSMDSSQALKLLENKFGNNVDIDVSEELVKALEFIPLAISQAAAYIHQKGPRYTVTKYLKEFQKNEQSRLDLLNHIEGDLRQDIDATKSIIGTCQISFDLLSSERVSAVDLLCLMSFFDGQGIPESLVQPLQLEEHDALVKDRFEENLVTLRNYCLIEVNTTGDIFKMHGLVQLSMRAWLATHQQTEFPKEEYIWRLNKAFPKPERENWGTCRRLLAHAERAIHYRPIEKNSLEEWASLLHNAASFAITQGRHDIAEDMARNAHSVREKILGKEDKATRQSFLCLIIGSIHNGRYDETSSLLAELIETSERADGIDHPDTLAIVRNFGVFLSYQDDSNGELLQFLILDRQTRKLGVAHSDTLTTMHRLVLTYIRQGQWEKAEYTGSRVLESRKTTLGAEHRDTLVSISDLATIYWNQRRLEEAESLELQVMNTRKRVLGAEDRDTLTSMSNLARIWKDMGNLDDAINLMDECSQGRTRVLGPKNSHTKTSLHMLSCWRSERLQK